MYINPYETNKTLPLTSFSYKAYIFFDIVSGGKRMISGCNSDKKLTFFKTKVATLSMKITVYLIL
jgi:hypothetical protein